MLTNNTVPAGQVSLVELFLDVRRDVLTNHVDLIFQLSRKDTELHCESHCSRTNNFETRAKHRPFCPKIINNE